MIQPSLVEVHVVEVPLTRICFFGSFLFCRTRFAPSYKRFSVPSLYFPSLPLSVPGSFSLCLSVYFLPSLTCFLR